MTTSRRSQALRGKVDVVTYEFENVPGDTAAFLDARVPVAPGVAALKTAQDRIAEKTFISGLGIPVAPFADGIGPRPRWKRPSPASAGPPC